MLIVDRIENSVVICEDMDSGAKSEFNLEFLPSEVKEGDVLKEEEGSWVIDEVSTAQRKKDLAERLNNLFKRK